MRANWYVAVAAGLAIAATAPNAVSAQLSGRVNDRSREQAREREQRASQQERERREVQRDRIRAQRERAAQNARRDARYDARNSRGEGPAFCRSGEGHPVFGRQWCRDKGFGLGDDRTMRGVLGGGDRDRDRSVWEDIILREPRDRRDRRRDASVERSVLLDVLGAVVLGRFESVGRQHAAGPISGRWLDAGNANVLELNAGSVPFARIVDTNRDGRVDDIIFR